MHGYKPSAFTLHTPELHHYWPITRLPAILLSAYYKRTPIVASPGLCSQCVDHASFYKIPWLSFQIFWANDSRTRVKLPRHDIPATFRSRVPRENGMIQYHNCLIIRNTDYLVGGGRPNVCFLFRVTGIFTSRMRRGDCSADCMSLNLVTVEVASFASERENGILHKWWKVMEKA